MAWVDRGAARVDGRLRGRILGVGRLLAAALLATAAPAIAAPGWYEARSNHFTVYSAGTEASVRAFAERLERYDSATRYLRGLPERPTDRSNPLTVYVVANQPEIVRLYQAGRRGTGDGVAGFYVPRAGGSIAFTPRRSGTGSKLDLDGQAVLFHEYAHHFLYANYSAAYPAWFSEGFAEFHATTSFKDDGGIEIGRPPLYRAYGLIAGKPLSLVAMLTADNRRLDGSQMDALYGRGWLLTHHLTFEPKRTGQLGRYLTLLNDGKPSLEAAQTAFGDLKVLDRELEKLILKPLFIYVIPNDKVATGNVRLRTLGPGEVAMMPIRMRSDRGVGPANAARVAADARRIAAAWPADPHVQTALAEAEYDAADYAAAEAAADRALVTDPKDVAALLYKGQAQLRRAASAQATDPAVWKAARGWLVKANRVDPDAAEPLYLFYRSFALAGMRPTDNAIMGLERAFELAPQDRGLRFALACQLLEDKRAKTARAILAPLAFDPHVADYNPAAILVTLIDRDDSAGIAAALKDPRLAKAIEDDD